MITPSAASRHDPSVQCPKCHIEMIRLDAQGTAIDRCDKCGGVWLDAGELAVLLKFSGDKKELVGMIDAGAATETHTRHAVGTVLCPRDHSPMAIVADKKQKHIEFEMCMTCCGVFFDAGELADLSDFTLRERVKAMFANKKK